MNHVLSAAAVLLFLSQQFTAAAAPATGRIVSKPGGYTAAKAGLLFHERLLSWKARGDIFEETVNAFRTHMDDIHTMPEGQIYYGYWQGEYWGKTMLSRCAYQRLTGDKKELGFIREKALQLVNEFQREDGYLGTYSNADFIGAESWNIWGRKYTMWALVEAYDLTGEKKLLDAALKKVRHLENQLARLKMTFGDTGCFIGMPSMSILNPVILLYERTGDKTCRRLADAIVAENDRADGRRPNIVANAFGDKAIHEWYPKPWEWAKGYEMLSVIEGLCRYSRITGKKRPYEAAKRLYEKLERYELNTIASVGYHDKFVGARNLPNVISEVCDVIHWMRLSRILNEIEPDPKYLDRWEECFFNAFLAGVYRDGAWGAHDVRGHGRRHLQGIYEAAMTYHFCCIANAPRGFCDWFENCFTVNKRGGYDLNFYTDGDYASKDIRVSVKGGYPVNGDVTLEVTAQKPLAVRLRVPGWSRVTEIDGARVEGPWHEMKFAEGTRTVKISFDMTPRIVMPPPQMKVDDAQFREFLVTLFEMPWHNKEMIGMIRKGPGVAVTRGPLVLAKCSRARVSDADTFGSLGIDGSWSVKATALGPETTWGLWSLEFEKNGVKKTVRASDYATSADADDWRNAFSIWF